MRNRIVTVFSVCVAMALIAGCGAPKAGSGQEAITNAKTLETAGEKVNYLVAQGKAFYNSKEFQEAVDIAQYILTHLDRDSKEGRDLLEKAKNELSKQVQSALQDAKKNFKGFGK